MVPVVSWAQSVKSSENPDRSHNTQDYYFKLYNTSVAAVGLCAACAVR
jgi:hypothetical protein